MKRQNRAFPLLVSTPALLFLVLLQGCGILDEGTPETARLEITGPAEDFQLVTTTDFDVLAAGEEAVNPIHLVSADTSTVSAPYDKSYSLGPRQRFYLKAFSAEGLSQPITVKVLVDGDERYNSTSTLEDSDLEFVYTIR
jgi:hypothetical protein